MAPKFPVLALLLSVVAFLLADRSWAQRADIPAAPPRVQSTMKRGGISLQYIALPSDSDEKETWAHLYVVPPKNAVPVGFPAGTPYTRAYFIESNTVSLPIPFYLDVFTSSGKTLQRCTSLVFYDQICPIEIHGRWREPDKKRGLVLMVESRLGNSGVWHVISLDDHLQPIARQQFPFDNDTAEPDYNTSFSESQTDARGFLKVGTVISAGEKKQEIWYEWQGASFVDPLASYFVIAATQKTRKAAEEFAVKHALEEYEIVSTDEHKEYSGLPPHAYLVVVKRIRGEKPAQAYQKMWQPLNKGRLKYTVLRAF